MKVIDLLNKIANKEEVPDAIKWGSHDFKWCIDEYIAKGEYGNPTLLDYLSRCPIMINDEIITFYKIEEKKIPEKIPEDVFEKYTKTAKIYQVYRLTNEIIDYLKNKGDE